MCDPACTVLQDNALTLMDVNPDRLEVRISNCRPMPSVPKTDECMVVKDADFVVTAFQQGGSNACELDTEMGYATLL